MVMQKERNRKVIDILKKLRGEGPGQVSEESLSLEMTGPSSQKNSEVVDEEIDVEEEGMGKGRKAKSRNPKLISKPVKY